MFWLPSNNTNSTAKSGIWVAELLMDCGRTHSGQKWFEFRPIRREVNGQVIKTELVPYGAVSDLNGGAAGLAYFPPWDAGNYWGICGRTTIAELNLPGTKLSHLKI